MLKALQRELREHQPLTALLGAEPVGGPWIFRQTLPVNVGGTGLGAVVISSEGGFTAPSRFHRMNFPRVRIDIYADDDDLVTGIAAEIDSVMHRPDAGEIVWGAVQGTPVRILSSTRLTELDTFDVAGSEVRRGLVHYGVVTG